MTELKTKDNRIEIMAARNKERWQAIRELNSKQAVSEFAKFRSDHLFAIGLMLYWAEGDNNPKSPQARLTNTDQRMIRLFLEFAYKFCGIKKDQVRINLILYPDLNRVECETYWSKFLKVPLSQFYKTQYIKGKHPTKRLENGICMVRIGSMNLKQKLIQWINLFVENNAGIV